MELDIDSTGNGIKEDSSDFEQDKEIDGDLESLYVSELAIALAERKEIERVNQEDMLADAGLGSYNNFNLTAESKIDIGSRFIQAEFEDLEVDDKSTGQFLSNYFYQAFDELRTTDENFSHLPNDFSSNTV